MRTFHIIKLSLAAAVILLCMPAKAQQLVGGKVSLLNKEVKKQAITLLSIWISNLTTFR